MPGGTCLNKPRRTHNQHPGPRVVTDEIKEAHEKVDEYARESGQRDKLRECLHAAPVPRARTREHNETEHLQEIHVEV